MKEEQTVRGLEEERLRKTIAIAEEQKKQAQDAAEGKQSELIEAKKEIRENTEHGITNLYSADGFEALVELSQDMNPVMEILADYEEEKRKIVRLENLIESPYFARIDFQFEDEEEAEQIYIGKSSLKEKRTREMYVYDWRSPIASVFYRFMTGKAFYDAPGGKIEGEVKLKRQYEIADGVLEYFFDTNRNISDEFLKQLLSQNTSPQMKAIVETIQEEQDIVIRDMGSDLLMVQGVAGSGKTSIALHRAAYLMYQGLQSRLAANSILIVSPNATFEQYISNVLPELGEENVASVVFDDVLAGVLKEKRIQSKNEFLEHAVTNNQYKKVVKASMECKTSPQFLKVLEQLLSDIPLRWIAYEEIYHKGECIAGKEYLREWMLRRPETPLGARLEQLENHILERAFGTLRTRGDGEERNRIREEVQRFTKFDLAEMYSRMFRDEAYFHSVTEDMEASVPLEEIRKYTLENLETGRLYYDDAIAITYLHLRIYGTGKYRNIRQVVIDEAQDYYPLQFEIFRLLFPNAKFTVLGDINQTLGKQEDLSLYEQIKKILDKKSPSLITLDKSFRCTNEILNFSLQFIGHRPEIESFNRAGDTPTVAVYEDRRALLHAIKREADVCREKGYQTICLLTKTERHAVSLFHDLQSEMDLQLITDRTMESLQGTFLMPVYMSKGLEFDAVIICDADARTYYDEDDKKLLYVECTRALHRLSLLCEGEKSPLLAADIAEKRI